MEILKKKIIWTVFLAFIFSTTQASDPVEDLISNFAASYEAEDKGEYNVALNIMKEIYDENGYEINLRLGWLAYQAGFANESISYYNRAMNLKPYSIEPKLGITYPLSSMGNWDALEKQYLDIIEISPHNNTALYNLGLIYYNRKQFEKAEVHFKTLVNLFPFDYDSLLMFAWTNFQLKKYREAKVLFQKALLNDPDSESAKEGLNLLD